jgi:hypothetical protein
MSRWLWLLVIAASAAGTAWPLPDLPVLKQVVSVWFVLVCPGMAVVRALGFQDHDAVMWTLAVALSLTIAAIVAATMLYAGTWSTSSALRALIVVTVAGLLAEILGWARRRAQA